VRFSKCKQTSCPGPNEKTAGALLEEQPAITQAFLMNSLSAGATPVNNSVAIDKRARQDRVDLLAMFLRAVADGKCEAPALKALAQFAGVPFLELREARRTAGAPVRRYRKLAQPNLSCRSGYLDVLAKVYRKWPSRLSADEIASAYAIAIMLARPPAVRA
jgi:hypothetical protein